MSLVQDRLLDVDQQSSVLPLCYGCPHHWALAAPNRRNETKWSVVPPILTAQNTSHEPMIWSHNIRCIPGQVHSNGNNTWWIITTPRKLLSAIIMMNTTPLRNLTNRHRSEKSNLRSMNIFIVLCVCCISDYMVIYPVKNNSVPGENPICWKVRINIYVAEKS